MSLLTNVPPRPTTAPPKTRSKENGKEFSLLFRLKYKQDGPQWYENSRGTVGAINWKNYSKPRTKSTWIDRCYVVRPYMKGTISSNAAYEQEPLDQEIAEAYREWHTQHDREQAELQVKEEARKRRQDAKAAQARLARNLHSPLGAAEKSPSQWRPSPIKTAAVSPGSPTGPLSPQMIQQRAKEQVSLAMQLEDPATPLGTVIPAVREAAQKEVVGCAEEDEEEDPEEIFMLVMAEIRRKANAKKGKYDSGLNLRAVFNEYDQDGGGTIDRDEFRNVLLAMGVHLDENQLSTVFRYFDKDGAGVEYGEFAFAFYNKDSVTKTKGAVRPRSPAYRWMKKVSEGITSPSCETPFMSPTFQGNSHLRDLMREAELRRAGGHYSHSIKLYTEALALCEDRPTAQAGVLAKRSAAYEGLMDYESAVEDSLASIGANKEGWRGYMAAGNANTGLRYFDRAAKYYKMGLKHAPGNRELQSKYERCLYHFRAQKYGVCY